MKRKILAVLLMMVLSMACIACDMEEAVETGSNTAVVSMENEVEKEEATSTPTPTIAPTPTERPIENVMVWLLATGEKYHNKNNCGRMNPSKARQVTKSEAGI